MASNHIYGYESWFESPTTFSFEVISKRAVFATHNLLDFHSSASDQPFLANNHIKGTEMSTYKDTTHGFKHLEPLVLKLLEKTVFATNNSFDFHASASDW